MTGLTTKAIAVCIAGMVAITIVTIVYFILFAHPSRTTVETAKAGETQAQGQAAAAQDANKVVITNVAKTRVTDTTTQENRRAITTAEGATQRATDAVDAVGRRAICLRQSARDLPECQRLRLVDPGRVAP